MGALELLALAAVAAGLLAGAPRHLGVDPLGAAGRALGVRGAAGGAQAVDGVEASLDRIDRELKDIGGHLEAVRHLAEERGAEIERFREGYHFSVNRSLARGVIKAVDMLADFRRQLEDVHGAAGSEVLADALLRFEAASAQLEMLLEANQIEAFWPEPGDPIEAASHRFEPIAVRASEDPAQHGRVAEVRYPGWVLVRGDGDQRVVREAQVDVFGPAKEES